MQSEVEFLKQCLLDEMNNKPVLLKHEKEMYFMFGLLIGLMSGAALIWVSILTF